MLAGLTRCTSSSLSLTSGSHRLLITHRLPFFWQLVYFASLKPARQYIIVIKLLLAATIVALSGLCPSQVSAATVEVSNCIDWETAVNATLIEDTTAVITASSFSYDDCGESSYKTFEVKSNLLKVESDVAWRKLCRFWGIRFEVTENGQLSFTMNAEFNLHEDKDPEVNGGFLHVEDGSTARFLKDLEVVGFKVKCSRDGDFCGELFDGGCVWNEGYFRVNGHATFTACDIQKISDGVPGLGGAIYNGASGSIMFEGGVTMQDMFINDIGDDNAAIYNAGKINIKGDSVFQGIVADNFDNRDTDQGVGAVRNKGTFTFSGPANFTLCESTVYNVAPGNMELSSGSVFMLNIDEGPRAGGAITNLAGATLDVPDDVVFSQNSVDSPSCENIYYQESAGTGQTDYDNEVFTCGP